MTLLPEEAKSFFKNWLGLLAFVNDKHNLIKNFGHPKKPTGISSEKVITLKTKLWEDVTIIDEYINSVHNLPEDDEQILKGWKNNIPGLFVIISHLKKHTVFMNDKQDALYGVIGISCPISEMLPPNMLPLMIETTLIPFKGRIIYDSLFNVYDVHIGPNMRRSYKSAYAEIKNEKGIVVSLG